MNTYRNTEVVGAYQVVEPGEQVFTRSGPRWAPSGSWVVYQTLGVTVMSNDEFVVRYAEWADPSPAAIGLAASSSDVALQNFVDDNSVATVVEFMKANPELVSVVQSVEVAGQNRKGITEFRN